jgi:hypothetical protein
MLGAPWIELVVVLLIELVDVMHLIRSCTFRFRSLFRICIPEHVDLCDVFTWDHSVSSRADITAPHAVQCIICCHEDVPFRRRSAHRNNCTRWSAITSDRVGPLFRIRTLNDLQTSVPKSIILTASRCMAHGRLNN